MAAQTQTSSHRGSRDEALTWDELESIFDLLCGVGNHHLPSFPAIVGAVSAGWFDAENIKHQATKLVEVEAAYRAQQTARVTFSGWLPNEDRWDFSYAPGAPRPRCEAILTGSPGAQHEHKLEVIRSTFPDPFEGTLIFVSWGGDTSLPVARVLHELLQSRFSNEEVFLSDRSIEPGDDPSRRILEEGLLKAEILVAVLTKDDVDRPWVIWETASVWARRKLVIPLFVDVQPRDVPGPLTTKVQGAPLSNKSKVDGVFAVIGRHLGVTAPTDLTDREYEQLVTASKGA